MHWTIEANMFSVLNAIDLAHSRGATIFTLPELAVTGFHRDIASLAKQELIVPQVQRLQEVCALRSIAVAIGTPTFGDDNTRFNSHVLINELGELVSVVSKNGLTAPEATFFSHGVCRPVSMLQGVRCTAVICREIEDQAQVCAQVPAGGVDLVFWPGQMRPDPDKPFTDPPTHVVQAQQLAQSLGAHVIQANWPNALNRPEESEHTGHSAVIAPTGELLFRLPKQSSGVAVFTIGENSFEWHPRED
jgi:predicted amidohydrolase